MPVPEAHLAAIAGGVLAQRVWPRTLPVRRGVRYLLGWPLLVFGGGIIVRAVSTAGRADLSATDRLLTDGPYARSRHPMYLAWTLLHLGIGLVGGSRWVLLSWVPAAAAVHREALREERALRQRFGSAFDRYAAAVPRYLPLRPSPRGLDQLRSVLDHGPVIASRTALW